jgi:hypothetical protein
MATPMPTFDATLGLLARGPAASEPTVDARTAICTPEPDAELDLGGAEAGASEGALSGASQTGARGERTGATGTTLLRRMTIVSALSNDGSPPGA